MLTGLEIQRILQTTDRFDAFEAEYEGQKVFAKQAKADKPRELLARVPHNSLVVDKIGQKTDFKFRTPKVIEYEGDWLITEWIDGELLDAKVGSETSQVADVLTNFLAVFDAELVVDSEVRRTFQSDSLADYMSQKLPQDLSSQQKAVLNKAKELFDELQPLLEPSWQDGDIRPGHIFADPAEAGAYVLIDPEHFDCRWPRFYSLANNFVKYVVRGPRPFAALVVDLFVQKSGVGEEDFFKPFLANVIVRGISLHWEPEYEPGGTEFNRGPAQELLKACLEAKNLADLLDLAK